MNASLGDSPPGSAAFRAAFDAAPIRLTKSNAEENASPIDSTIDVKNAVTLSINNPGSLNITNLIPSNAALNASMIKPTAAPINSIIFRGNVIYTNFKYPKISFGIKRKAPNIIPPIPFTIPIKPLITPSSN